MILQMKKRKFIEWEKLKDLFKDIEGHLKSLPAGMEVNCKKFWGKVANELSITMDRQLSKVSFYTDQMCVEQ